ncbi:MAG: fibronectin type III domain-containing protein, partial [Bacteroidota bacterium]
GYKVERADGLTNLTWEQISSTEENTTSYQDTDLNAESIYSYRVIAYNDIGESQPSNADSAKTYPAQAVPPPAPTGLLAAASSSTQIDLTWDDTQYETGYRIERALAVDGPWMQIAAAAADSTSYQDKGLNPFTTYFYRLYAYNEAGDGPYSEIGSATTLPLDTQGPSIVIQQPSPPATGMATVIIATISDTSGVQSAALWFRPGGGQASSTAMSGVGGQYSGTIPSAAITPSGVEYYVEAVDMRGNSSREPALGFQSLQVSVSGEGVVCSSPQPGGNQQTAYRMVSVPMDASSKRPDAILVDDLGAYDITRWRFFELIPDQGYAEYPNTNPMIPGKAFWLIVYEGGRVIDTGPCRSVPTGGEYQITVQAGWTLVGNPFNFAVPVNNLRFASGTEPVVLRSYTGAWNDPGVAAVTVMEPFAGYAVSSQTATQLLIDPDLSSGGTLAKSPSVDSTGWAIGIHARCQGALDVDNIALACDGASRDLDSLDKPEPPVIGGYVSVYFPHPGWETVLRTYSVDARPVPREGDAWQFEVRSNIRDVVHLRFEGIMTIPDEDGVVLLDEVTGASLDLRDVQEYSFAITNEEIARPLRILVGTQEYVRSELEKAGSHPVGFGLSQNFPNPFNPLTTIGYSLPAPSRVRLTLYDLVGREVATLVDGIQLGGRRSVVLDGSDLASGVYYYRLQATALEGGAGSYSQTRKLLLLR